MLAAHADSEAEQLVGDREVARQLGTIDVRVYRVTRRGMLDLENQVLLPGIDGALPEKSLRGKDLSHSTTCARPKPCVQWTLINLMYHDDWQHPIARFIFRYRSKGK